MENDEDEETLICDEHPEKITDLAELKQKMESIEDYLKKKILTKQNEKNLKNYMIYTINKKTF